MEPMDNILKSSDQLSPLEIAVTSTGEIHVAMGRASDLEQANTRQWITFWLATMPVSNFIDQCAFVMLMKAARASLVHEGGAGEEPLLDFYNRAAEAIMSRLGVIAEICVRPDGPLLPQGLLDSYLTGHVSSVPKKVSELFHSLKVSEHVVPLVGAGAGGVLRGVRFAGAVDDVLLAIWRLELEAQGFDHPELIADEITFQIPGLAREDTPDLRQPVIRVRLRLNGERGEAVSELLTAWESWKADKGSFFDVALSYRRCIIAGVPPALSLRAMQQASALPNVLGVFRCTMWPSEETEVVATFMVDREPDGHLPMLIATFSGPWVDGADLDHLADQMRIQVVKPLSPFDLSMIDFFEGRSHLSIFRDPQQMDAFAMMGLTVQVDDADGLLTSTNSALQELLDAWWSELLRTSWEPHMSDRLIAVCEAISILSRCTKVA